MRLYTKNGDKGITSLYDGRKVSKDSEEIKLLATIDSFIALYGETYPDDIEILTALMDICTMVANPSQKYIFDPQNVLVSLIEEKTDSLMVTLPPLTKFILSDNHVHVIRTACRQLETELIFLKNNRVIQFINRLSSLLFARAYEQSKDSTRYYVSTYIQKQKENKEKEEEEFNGFYVEKDFAKLKILNESFYNYELQDNIHWGYDLLVLVLVGTIYFVAGKILL